MTAKVKLTILELVVEPTITTAKLTDEWFEYIYDAIKRVEEIENEMDFAPTCLAKSTRKWYIKPGPRYAGVANMHVHITLQHIPSHLDTYSPTCTNYWEIPPTLST